MRRSAAGVLLGALLCLLLAYPVRAAWPLTGSQVITLEHGPDGLWLSQAWVLELQAGPEWRAAVIYDTWRRSVDGLGWTMPYRQIDVNLTWEPREASRPVAVTAGRRWRLQDGGTEGEGPWVYGILTIGW
jgi:hypothetical protein